MQPDNFTPTILPLDLKGSIYALQDEHGSTIGTGTREVCELLLYFISKQTSQVAVNKLLATAVNQEAKPNVNIRSAIAI